MKKRVLITGAGSGFGEGTAIGLAKAGHEVIAGMHIWPQVTQMRRKTKSLELKNLRIEKLDVLDAYDVACAVQWDIDILVNNAAIGYSGPLSEIPLDLIKRTFETNIFGGLNLAQKFIRKWVDEKRSGKIVFISSVLGLLSRQNLGAYAASKHAIECIAKTLQDELRTYNIQVQTINPAAFRTGFNDTMSESALHWMDDQRYFTKKDDVQKFLKNAFENQGDPNEMINQMVEIIPAESGKFRNVFPKAAEDFVKKSREEAWENKI